MRDFKVTVYSVAPPVHRLIDDRLFELSNIHWVSNGSLSSFGFNKFAKVLREIEPKQVEYARAQILHTIDFIRSTIRTDSSNLYKHISSKTYSLKIPLVSFMNDIEEEIKLIYKTCVKKPKVQKNFQIYASAMAFYIEGFFFLENLYKSNNEEWSDIYQEKQEVFTQLKADYNNLKTGLGELYAKSLKHLIELELIEKEAITNMKTALELEYDHLQEENLERLLITVGQKNLIWKVIQFNTSDYQNFIQEQPHYELSNSDLVYLQQKTADVLDDFDKYNFSGFTNLIKKLAFILKFRGSLISKKCESRDLSENKVEDAEAAVFLMSYSNKIFEYINDVKNELGMDIKTNTLKVVFDTEHNMYVATSDQVADKSILLFTGDDTSYMHAYCVDNKVLVDKNYYDFDFISNIKDKSSMVGSSFVGISQFVREMDSFDIQKIFFKDLQEKLTVIHEIHEIN